jgi:hypothetical protein
VLKRLRRNGHQEKDAAAAQHTGQQAVSRRQVSITITPASSTLALPEELLLQLVHPPAQHTEQQAVEDDYQCIYRPEPLIC